MKYVWWYVVIIIYLITLLTYAILGHIMFNGDKKLNNIDGIFFGVTSVITISLIPMFR